MSHLLKFVPGLPKVIQGSSRLVTGHPGSPRSTPYRFLPVGEPGVEPGMNRDGGTVAYKGH